METREIPRDQWTHFLDGFSRRHDGWLVTVEVLGDEGAQVEARELPLTGITADQDRGHTISVLLGGRPGKDAAHIIHSPAAVRVEESDGVERALEIEKEGGEKTILTFRSAVPPEMVDGVLPERSGHAGDKRES
jgi:Family of unknown function (DUF5335)